MKRFFKFGFVVVAIVAIGFGIGCGGGNGDSNSNPSVPITLATGDGLTVEQANSSDQTPRVTPRPASQNFLADGSSLQQIETKFGLPEIVLSVKSSKAQNDIARTTAAAESPQSPNDYKQICIDRMIQMGNELVGFSSFPEGTTQKKLSYVYGSKQYTDKKRPPAGCCTEPLYGLDCSGLVYLCATTYAGLGLPVGNAANQSNPSSWNIPKSWGVTMKDVTSKANSSDSYEGGDILFWAGPGHIGIVSESGTSVIQSNGSPGCKSDGCPNTGPCKDESQCTKNQGETRGPSVVTIDNIKKWSGFGKPSRVLRLSTGSNLDGTWSGPFTLSGFGECTTSSFTSNFTFIDKNGEDGGPITATFNYSGNTSGAISFTGNRNKNKYVLSESTGDRSYSGTLNVDPNSSKLDTIDVSAPYFCGSTQAPTPVTFVLERNESGNTNSQGNRVEKSNSEKHTSLTKR